jgi:hypothetical protein
MNNERNPKFLYKYKYKGQRAKDTRKECFEVGNDVGDDKFVNHNCNKPISEVKVKR